MYFKNEPLYSVTVKMLQSIAEVIPNEIYHIYNPMLQFRKLYAKMCGFTFGGRRGCRDPHY